MEQRIEPRVGVVIVAGGSGRRMGGTRPKQYQFLGNMPILVRTVNSFAEALPGAEMVVVVASDMVEYWANLSSRFECASHKTVSGGEQRQESVRAGIEALSEGVDIIAVHDGARPLVAAELIRRCVEGAVANGSAVPVVEMRDSLREVDGEGSRVVDRSKIRAVQTPQVFDAVVLRRAYRAGSGAGFTDDASLVEASGERVWLCEGETKNIKITTREDLILAQMILENGEQEV